MRVRGDQVVLQSASLAPQTVVCLRTVIECDILWQHCRTSVKISTNVDVCLGMCTGANRERERERERERRERRERERERACERGIQVKAQHYRTDVGIVR